MDDVLTTQDELILRQQMHDLLDIVIDTNGFEMRQQIYTGGKPTIWFDYSGHVNEVEIRLIENGYSHSSHSESIFRAYLDKPINEKNIERVRNRCKKAAEITEMEALEKAIVEQEEKIGKESEILDSMRRRKKELEEKEGESANG